MSRRAVPPPTASDALTAEAARFADDLARVAPDAGEGTVLLAVSGGPDSMAMLTLAVAAMPARVVVASVDHGLRPGAAEEVAMVAQWCARIGAAHRTLRPNVVPTGASVQAAARQARYALLAAEAKRIGTSYILTAHHADDQAETFLMRASRGSGLAGLAGVRAATTIEGAAVIRPLLDWRRAELRAIVRREEVPFVDDPSNADPRYDRTRFRQLLDAHEWLDPPGLARSATALGELDAELRGLGDWAWTTRAERRDDGVRLDVADLPRELRRRLLRRAIGDVRALAAIETPAWTDAVNIERLLDTLERGGRSTQAGVLASARGDAWRVRPAPARRTG